MKPTAEDVQRQARIKNKIFGKCETNGNEFIWYPMKQTHKNNFKKSKSNNESRSYKKGLLTIVNFPQKVLAIIS